MLRFKNKSFSTYINTFMVSFWTVCIFLSIKSFSSHNPYPAFIFITHLMLMVVSWVALASAPVAKNSIKIHKFNFLLLLFLSCAIYCIFNSFTDQHLIWLDEYTHSIISMDNPIQGSANQQQPVLGYIWYFFVELWGETTIKNLRFASALPFILSFIMFGLAGLLRGRSWSFLLIFSSLILCNGLMLFSFLDARSTSIGILNLSILAFTWAEIDNDQTPHLDWTKKFILFSSSYLFLESIGFQAPIIIISLIVTYFLSGYLFRKIKFHEYAKVFFFSLLAFLPIQLYLLKIAAKIGYVGILPSFVSNDLFINFKDHFFQSYAINHSYFLFGLISLSLLYYTIQNRNETDSKKNLFIGLFLFIITPVLLELIFSIFIRWNFNYRYRLSFIALSLWLASLALSNVKTRFQISLSVILILSIFGLSQRNQYYGAMIKDRKNWGEVYTYINKEFLTKEYRAYVVGECQEYNLFYCNNLPVGLEFYVKSNQLENFPSRFRIADNINTFYNDNGITSDSLYPLKKHLIFILERSEPLTRPIPMHDLFKVQILSDFLVISSLAPLSSDQGIRKILKYSTSFIDLNPKSLYLYELLLRNYLVTGRKDDALKVLAKIKNSKELQKSFFYSDMNKARFGKIKLSVDKYFESRQFEKY